MTADDLTPVERQLLRQAAIGESEARDMEASRLHARAGNTTTVQEWREEAAVLRNAAAKLAGDQSPAASRAHAREDLAALSDVELDALIGAAGEELDARHLFASRPAGREVSHRYTGRRTA